MILAKEAVGFSQLPALEFLNHPWFIIYLFSPLHIHDCLDALNIDVLNYVKEASELSGW